MSKLAPDAIGEVKLTVLADRGYSDGERILQDAEEGINTLVPKPITSYRTADGRIHKLDFIYIAKRNECRCPAGERAIWRMTTIENGHKLQRYWPSACPRCSIKSRCTPSDYRRTARWEHEQVLDDMQRRLDRLPPRHEYVDIPSSTRVQRSRHGWMRLTF